MDLMLSLTGITKLLIFNPEICKKIIASFFNHTIGVLEERQEVDRHQKS